MDNGERIIDMRNVFNYLKGKIIILLIVVFLGGAALGGYNYMKQKKDIDNVTEEYVDILNLTIRQNHDAFYFKKIPFSDAEPYKGIYNSTAKVYVDFKYDDIENYENADFSMVNTKLESDATLLLCDFDILEEIIDELQLRSYGDMKNITADKLRWLINKNFLGAHVMTVVVSDVNPERAKLICDKLIEKFEKKSSQVSFIDSAVIINSASMPTDNSFFGKSASAAPITAIDKKRVLKYGIAGAFLAFVIFAVVFVTIYIVYDSVRCEADLNNLGLESVAGAYRKKTDYSRIAHAFNLNENVKNLLVVAVDGRVDAEAFTENTGKELKKIGSSIKLVAAQNFKNDVTALEKVKDCDAVVYLIKYDKTRMSDVFEAKRVLERTKTRSLGAVLV